MDHEKKQRLIEDLAKDQKDQKDRQYAETLAKHATRSNLLVSLLVRQLRTHYEERSRSAEDSMIYESVFPIIIRACDNLIESIESYEKSTERILLSDAGTSMSYESAQLAAERVAKHATQNSRMVSLLVRELRTYYKWHCLSTKWSEEEVFILRIALACLHLGDALDTLETNERIVQFRKSTDA